MKIFAILAAGAAMVAAPTVASAQMHGRTVETHRSVSVRGNGHANRWRNKKVCSVRWNHGHKTRVCRNVRTRW